MCTMITEQAGIVGSGKGTPGWIKVDRVNVSYDHPAHMTIEHTLNIDFVDQSGTLGDRVAVELTRESARRLVDLIGVALERGAEVDGPEPAAADYTTSSQYAISPSYRRKACPVLDTGPVSSPRPPWTTDYARVLERRHFHPLIPFRKYAISRHTGEKPAPYWIRGRYPVPSAGSRATPE